MSNHKAIATIAIGDKYLANWKQYCEPGWAGYAEKFGYDLICLKDPLDTSHRAASRSVSWQKCLILRQDFAKRYDQIIWIDSDIMINPAAPDIAANVPLDKIGAVEDLQFRDRRFIDRIFRLWPAGEAVQNFTVKEYYMAWGLPGDCDRFFNGGVLVVSPTNHRELLEHVYFDYEEKADGGRKWHMEQRPLAYEAVRSGSVNWLDQRFNVNLWSVLYEICPFLMNGPMEPLGIVGRVRRRIKRKIEECYRVEAVNAIYQASYFLHFASTIEQMKVIRHQPKHWWDVV